MDRSLTAITFVSPCFRPVSSSTLPALTLDPLISPTLSSYAPRLPPIVSSLLRYTPPPSCIPPATACRSQGPRSSFRLGVYYLLHLDYGLPLVTQTRVESQRGSQRRCSTTGAGEREMESMKEMDLNVVHENRETSGNGYSEGHSSGSAVDGTTESTPTAKRDESKQQGSMNLHPSLTISLTSLVCSAT